MVGGVAPLGFQGSGFRVSGFGLRISGFGLRVEGVKVSVGGDLVGGVAAREAPEAGRAAPAGGMQVCIQVYLAHEKTPNPTAPPWSPRHSVREKECAREDGGQATVK